MISKSGPQSGQRVLNRDRLVAQRNIIVKQVEDLTKTRYVKPEVEDQFLLQFAKVHIYNYPRPYVPQLLAAPFAPSCAGWNPLSMLDKCTSTVPCLAFVCFNILGGAPEHSSLARLWEFDRIGSSPYSPLLALGPGGGGVVE